LESLDEEVRPAKSILLRDRSVQNGVEDDDAFPADSTLP